MNLSRRQGAFTLIELLVVISIVSLLSSVVMSTLGSARDKARMAAALQFEASLYRAVGASAGGMWRFDEGTGTAAADASGNGSHGVLLNSPTWSSDTPTGRGGSLRFQAVNQCVSVAAPSGSDISKVTDPGIGFTMGSWFKAEAASAIDGYVFMRVGFHTGLRYRPGSLFGIDGVNTHILTNISLNDGKWHYLAMSVNDSTKTISLYLDGRQVASQAYSGTLRTYGTANYRIGGMCDNNIYNVVGLIDNPMIFGVPYR
jgi:prepilin-type N-terminal cleavage/methylation domain-containing protein